MTDFAGDVVLVDAGTTFVVNSLMSATPMADFTHDYNFASVLESKVQVSAVRSGVEFLWPVLGYLKVGLPPPAGVRYF